MFSGNISCCDRYLVSDSSDARRNAHKKKLNKILKPYLYLMHRFLYELVLRS